MTTQDDYKKPKSIDEARNNYRYKGKIIVEAGGRIFTARSGEKAHSVLKRVRKQYPDQTPTVAYLPKSNEVMIPSMTKIKSSQAKAKKKDIKE